MKWIRKLLGLDFPDPQVGQLWRSEFSGRRIRVSEVETWDQGTVVVSVQRERGANCWSMGNAYCYGLDRWRRKLRCERRALVGHDADGGDAKC